MPGGGMRTLPALALLFAGEAGAAHDWIGIDLCRTYPELMPSEQEFAAAPEPESAGGRLVGALCGQCHYAPGLERHSAAEWDEIVPRMALIAQVTQAFSPERMLNLPDAAQQTELLGYLTRHARLDAVAGAGLDADAGRCIALAPVFGLAAFALVLAWRRLRT
jgi:cytochrome c5